MALGLVAAVAAFLVALRPGPEDDLRIPPTAFQIRRVLFREIRPVKLSNCELQRFGEANDGGYLVCGNLLGAVRGGYSYGISGYDGWGCEVSRRLGVTVHQYDCFNLTRPVCDGGATVFHGECIGTDTAVLEGRPFDTIERQIAKNGDKDKRLIVKMDVEGAEWDSFNTAPEDVLRRIDQLAVEFHGVDEARFLTAVRRLKQYFHVAHLHWNNYACANGLHPFPAWAYEILFVNKRIGILDPSAHVVLPHPLDAPNRFGAPECRVDSM